MTQQNSPTTNSFSQWLSLATPILLVKTAVFILTIIAITLFLARLFLTRANITQIVEPEASSPLEETAMPWLQTSLVELQIGGQSTSEIYQIDPPQRLKISNIEVPVSPHSLGKDHFLMPVITSTQEAVWLENTVINYAFRLPSGRGYRDILQNVVAASGEISMTTSQGKQILFTVRSGALQPAADIPKFLQQTHPAITFIWIDEDNPEISYIVSGNYSPPDQTQFPQTDTEAPPAEGVEEIAPLVIQLNTAELKGEAQLWVQGTIKNSGVTDRLVEEGDIRLTSGEMPHLIAEIDPPLPWIILPGNNEQPFTITFERPDAKDAVLTIEMKQFELGPLR
jgi:hypothetical protein